MSNGTPAYIPPNGSNYGDVAKHFSSQSGELTKQQALDIIHRHAAHVTPNSVGSDWIDLAAKQTPKLQNWQEQLVNWMTKGTEDNTHLVGVKAEQLINWIKTGTPVNLELAQHKAGELSEWAHKPETQKVAGNLAQQFWQGASGMAKNSWQGASDVAKSSWHGLEWLAHKGQESKPALADFLHNNATRHANHSGGGLHQLWLNLDNALLQHLDKAKVVTQGISQNADNWLTSLVHHMPHPNTPTEAGLSAAALGIAGGLGWLGARLSGRAGRSVLTTAEKTVIKTV